MPMYYKEDTMSERRLPDGTIEIYEEPGTL